MRPSPTESVEATEKAPLSAAAEPRSPIRSGIATRGAGRPNRAAAPRGRPCRGSRLRNGPKRSAIRGRGGLRPAVGGEVEVPGRRYVETDPADVGRVPAAVSFTRPCGRSAPEGSSRQVEDRRLPGFRSAEARRRAACGAPCAGCRVRPNVGPEPGPGGSEFESERNACRAHFESSARVAHRKSAALGERQLPELQGDVGAPGLDRVDPQVECREGDERRVESRGGAVAQRAVPPPGCQSARRFPPARSTAGRACRRVRAAFRSGAGQGGRVGAQTPRSSSTLPTLTCWLSSRTRTPRTLCRQGVPQFGHRGCGPHPEGGVQDRDFPDVERPGRRSRAVGLFPQGPMPSVREMSPSESVIRAMPAHVGPEVGPGLPEQKQSGRRGAYPNLPWCLCSGPRSGQFETADDDLFRISGHRATSSEPAAIDERYRPVGQQRLFDRQPERRRGGCGDRKVHAERPQRRSRPPARMNPERPERRAARGEQHRQQDDEQCPKRHILRFFSACAQRTIPPAVKFKPLNASRFCPQLREADLSGCKLLKPCRLRKRRTSDKRSYSGHFTVFSARILRAQRERRRKPAFLFLIP